MRLLEIEEDSILLNLTEQRLSDYKPGEGIQYEETLKQIDEAYKRRIKHDI